MEIRQVIERALRFFPEHKQSSNEELVDALVSGGIAEEIAWKILTFTPLAFCRVMFKSSGIHFSATYIQRKNLNLEEEKYFNDELFFGESITIAESKVGGTSGDYWLSIAGRSAEFQAINSLLIQGSRLENIRLTKPIVIER